MDMQDSTKGQKTSSRKQGKAGAITRRGFLNQAAAGAGAVALMSARSRTMAAGANERIRMGIIGSGGMGRHHMNVFKEQGVEWIAVSDVYEPSMAEGMKIAGPSAKSYKEYERLLENKDMDAVLIASPEHWHHKHLIDTLKAGFDAYCEKPMCWSIQQGAEMVKAVRSTDRIVQIGMQRRSSPIIHKIKKEVFESGMLGDIYMVRAEWYWDAPVDTGAQIEKSQLDWERFCGPAGKQEFHPLKYLYWRYFWPFSGGNETDQGTHLMDVIQWMMGANQPVSAVQIGDIFREAKPTETPDNFCCTFRYPKFMATWTLSYSNNTWRNGWSITFHGTKGALFLTEAGYRVFNQVNGWEAGWPKPKLEELPGSVTSTVPHTQNFLECLKTRKQPNAPVEIGHTAVRPLHLANAALRAGRQANLAEDGVTIKLA
jgi:predicted dehydrogenase